MASLTPFVVVRARELTLRRNRRANLSWKIKMIILQPIYINSNDCPDIFIFSPVPMPISITMTIPASISVRSIPAAASIVSLSSTFVTAPGPSAVLVPLSLSLANSVSVAFPLSFSVSITFSVFVLTIFIRSGRRHVRTEVWHWLSRLGEALSTRHNQWIIINLAKSVNVLQTDCSEWHPPSRLSVNSLNEFPINWTVEHERLRINRLFKVSWKWFSRKLHFWHESLNISCNVRNISDKSIKIDWHLC